MTLPTMRRPRFRATCLHIEDQWLDMNGGRVNLDHWLRVLRARTIMRSVVLDRSTAKPIPASQWTTPRS